MWEQSRCQHVNRMIPKIIHYCWLSGEPIPDAYQAYLLNWKKLMPDYEFLLWDQKRFDIQSHPWVLEAMTYRKYASASDYIRLHALYEYGGIYLDLDVEVLKPFDDFLNLPYFIGKEDSVFGFEAATMGAKKNSVWIKKCMDRFEGRRFYRGWGSFDQKVLPEVIREVVEGKYQILDISVISEFVADEDVFCRFPTSYFSPKNWFTKVLTLQEETYSIHHFNNSSKNSKPLPEDLRFRLSRFMEKSGLRRLNQIPGKQRE